ncbi:hypothetical protein QJS10_CPB11g00379 [Acorus calamus]|uniref:Uncharacterized protein n=1 Tax=Acorus calamus TaxID=4465 RepID=A0AAV9DUX9_ACOCL|nr:hypothetical protein QJS10_CPB11g00379 [Acorus calamus]
MAGTGSGNQLRQSRHTVLPTEVGLQYLTRNGFHFDVNLFLYPQLVSFLKVKRLGVANDGCDSDHGSIASDSRMRFTSTVKCDEP